MESGLYNYALTLQGVFNGYRVLKKEKYILIGSDDEHLRVDKFYARSAQMLAPVHYTLVLSKADNIKVRMYYQLSMDHAEVHLFENDRKVDAIDGLDIASVLSQGQAFYRSVMVDLSQGWFDACESLEKNYELLEQALYLKPIDQRLAGAQAVVQCLDQLNSIQNPNSTDPRIELFNRNIQELLTVSSIVEEGPSATDVVSDAETLGGAAAETVVTEVKASPVSLCSVARDKINKDVAILAKAIRKSCAVNEARHKLYEGAKDQLLSLQISSFKADNADLKVVRDFVNKQSKCFAEFEVSMLVDAMFGYNKDNVTTVDKVKYYWCRVGAKRLIRAFVLGEASFSRKRIKQSLNFRNALIFLCDHSDYWNTFMCFRGVERAFMHESFGAILLGQFFAEVRGVKSSIGEECFAGICALFDYLLIRSVSFCEEQLINSIIVSLPMLDKFVNKELAKYFLKGCQQYICTYDKRGWVFQSVAEKAPKGNDARMTVLMAKSPLGYCHYLPTLEPELVDSVIDMQSARMLSYEQLFMMMSGLCLRDIDAKILRGRARLFGSEASGIKAIRSEDYSILAQKSGGLVEESVKNIAVFFVNSPMKSSKQLVILSLALSMKNKAQALLSNAFDRLHSYYQSIVVSGFQKSYPISPRIVVDAMELCFVHAYSCADSAAVKSSWIARGDRIQACYESENLTETQRELVSDFYRAIKR